MFKFSNIKHFSLWRKLRLRLDWESKIRHKLFLMLLLLTTIPFIFFAYFAIQKTSDYIYLETKQETLYLSTRLQHFIDHYYSSLFISIQDIFKTHLSNQSTHSSFKTNNNPLFQIFTTSSEIIAFSVHDKNHRELIKYLPPDHKQPLPTYKNWRKIDRSKNNESIISPYYNSNFNKTILPFQFSLDDLQGNRYLITVFIDISHFKQSVLNWQFGDDTKVTLATTNGTVIVPLTFPPNRQLETLKAKLHQGKKTLSIMLSKNEQQQKIYLAHTKSNYLGWSIFVERRTNIASTLVNRLRLIMIIFVACAVLFALIGSVFIVSKIVDPIEELDAGIKLLENGLLLEALPIRSKDEIARVTMSFNQMAQTLMVREEEVKNQNRKLAFFNDITRTINQNVNLKELLTSSLQKIIFQLQAASGWTYIYEPHHKQLHCVVQIGMAVKLPPELSIHQQSENAIVTVYQSGKAQLIRDVNDRQLHLADLVEARDQNLILIPLRSQSKVLGVLGITSRTRKRFRFRDLDLITKIGDELGLAIENAHLYAELQLKINELEAVNKDLQELDQLKNRILSNVSHELRTPITSIRTYIELFLSDKIGHLDDMQKDKLAIVKRNINHLLTLIEDLLTLARIQDQKMHLKNLEVVQLQDFIDEIISSTEVIAKAKGLILQKTGIDQPLMVRINRPKIIQVLQNLVSNAIKFTENGEITINLEVEHQPPSPQHLKARNLVKIEVRDTGIGIPNKLLSKIFHRFYQIDSSSTRKYVGTGLGLSIVKEILEAHHSKIHVESRVDQGTSFWFKLPIVNEIHTP